MIKIVLVLDSAVTLLTGAGVFRVKNKSCLNHHPVGRGGRQCSGGWAQRGQEEQRDRQK